MKKKILVLLSLLTLVLTLFSVQSQASAATKWKMNGNWVTLTRNVKILKYKNTVPSYKSYVVKTYTAKKGSHYKLMHWGTDHTWVLNSGKFKTTNSHTYVVSAAGTSWFKMGTSKISKTKSFHGYKIERKYSGYDHNTYYDKQFHCVLSDYAPTQKSKVIFEYGSHVVPTRHEWDRVTAKSFTAYKYRSGSWHKTYSEKY